MIQIGIEDNFESWRAAARTLLQNGVHPRDVMWTSTMQSGLFQNEILKPVKTKNAAVPPEFLTLAVAAACFDDGEKWPLLYRLLFRIIFEKKHLLEIDSDPDVRRARLMEKAVNRDVHKFHAFVRFRRIKCDGDEIFGAWHEPQHLTVERTTPFFARRFGTMKFSIFTPKGCSHWDLEKLSFSPAVERSSAPTGDEMEELWLLYYSSIFNPFRLKVRAMKKEFPVRHWRTLPEAVLIPGLIRQAHDLE